MSWSRYPLPENVPDGFRCVQLLIPDDDEYTQLLVGSLSWLAFWDAYDRDAEKRGREVAALWRQSLDSLAACGDDPLPPEIITQVINQYHAIFYKEMEEEMSQLRIEFIDGKPYLEQDCGCGERAYYPLTSASVNPSTGAVGSALDSPPSYIDTVPLTPEQSADCYADKVADVIVGALSTYTNAVFDFALIGIGAFFPATTGAIIGAVEIQQAVAAALNGNLTLDFSNVGYTSSEVIDVFQSSEFRSFIVDRLGDDQSVSRWVLELVSLRLLNRNDLNFPTPTYPVFAAWVKMCDIAQLNSQLQLAATECATGNAIPGAFEFDAAQSFVFDVPTFDYTIVEAGNLPDIAEGTWLADEGWRNREVSGKNAFVGCQIRAESRVVSAVRFTLSGQMTGDINLVSIIEGDDNTVVKEVEQVLGLTDVLVVLDEPTLMTVLEMRIKSNTTTTVDNDIRIEGVIVYTVGGVYSEGDIIG